MIVRYQKSPPFDIEIAILKRVFGNAGNKISQKAAKALAAGRKSATWWANLEAQVDAIYGVLDKFWPKYAQAIINRNYIDEGNRIDRFMRKAGILKSLDRGDIHSSVVNLLIRDSVADMHNAIQGGMDSVHRLFRRTQQTVMQDSFISQSIAQEITAGGARRQASSAIEEKLRNNILDGQVFEVNGRQYDPAYYSELVARTRTREAQSLAIKNAMAEHGQDLVQFSSHEGGDDEECLAMGGNTDNIYSLMAGTKLPPWHPNCKHVTIPFIPDPGEEYTVSKQDAA